MNPAPAQERGVTAPCDGVGDGLGGAVAQPAGGAVAPEPVPVSALPGAHQAQGWPFGDLIPLRYGAIIADPPWAYQNYSVKGQGKGAAGQYDCMGTLDIAALPVSQLAAPDCALFMWGTFPMMPDAIALMEAWGFAFKTGGAWAKQSKTGNKLAFGTGYILRAAAEFFIVGTIGKPKVLSRSVRNLILAPVRGHSRKPDDLHDMVRQIYAGPYCELFARERRPGWDAWGNQTDHFAPSERSAA